MCEGYKNAEANLGTRGNTMTEANARYLLREVHGKEDPCTLFRRAQKK